MKYFDEIYESISSWFMETVDFLGDFVIDFSKGFFECLLVMLTPVWILPYIIIRKMKGNKHGND